MRHRLDAALLALIVLVALASACGGTQATSAAPGMVGAAAEEASTEGVTIVSVVGTLHTAHRQDGYGLVVVEHAVRQFRPDVVLVELPPDEFDAIVAEVDARRERAEVEPPANRWVEQLPELYDVVIPLRDELGYTLEPVSGWTDAADAARRNYFDEHPRGPLDRRYIASRARLSTAVLSNDGLRNHRWLHGDEFRDLTGAVGRALSYATEDEMRPGGELGVHARHAALIEDALARHRGERVLVVFDVNSRWYIEAMLDVRGDVMRLRADRFLP